MYLPIPTHLQSYLKPIGKNDERKITGKIFCNCGGNIFEIWQSNNQNIIKLFCKKCGKDILLFDSGKHGWDGFVCGEDNFDRTKPLVKYQCKKCKNDAFQVVMTIFSQGKQDFIDVCVSNNSTFSTDDWVNGFDWIKGALTCCNCQHKEKNWLDFETA